MAEFFNGIGAKLATTIDCERLLFAFRSLRVFCIDQALRARPDGYAGRSNEYNDWREVQA